MYCHQCAAQNAEGAKFCRGCGAALESALVRTGDDDPAEAARSWAAKYGEGVRNVSTGAMLMTVAALICVPLALFAPAEVPWVLVWMVFFGWLACWGGITFAGGVGELLEARSMLRLIRAGGEVPSAAAKLRPPHDLARSVPETSDLAAPLPASSVIENTTKLLNENSPARR